MKLYSLYKKDEDLVLKASETIEKLYREDHHYVAAAVRTVTGDVFTSVNLDTYVGSLCVCAEPIAIIQAVMAEGGKASKIETVVAVRKKRPDKGGQVDVVAPCGQCREQIADYAPEAFVIVPSANGPAKVRIRSLLPNKYTRETRT